VAARSKGVPFLRAFASAVAAFITATAGPDRLHGCRSASATS